MSDDVAERFTTGGWSFTSDVVDVFDDHVRASVPHYDVFQDLVAAASDWLLPDGGVFVDLGASTGTTAEAVLARHPHRDITAWLYDEQTEMLDKARTKLSGHGGMVQFSDARIEAGPYDHHGADLTVALFTLQFLHLRGREETLRLARAHAGETGALLVAEKVHPADTRWAEIANDLSHDWKADHGISDAAIRAKARALRGVLRPSTLDVLMETIRGAGWAAPEVIFRWHNWVLVGAFANHLAP